MVAAYFPSYGYGVLSALFQPWRQSQTWWTFVYSQLSFVIGLAMFIYVLVLGALSVALLIIFPLGVLAGWLLFVGDRGFAHLERNRLAVLHGVFLDDPVPRLEAGSWWNRLGQRLRNPARWKELAYGLVRFPTAAITSLATLALWSGGVVLASLPASIYLMPGHQAHFGLFSVSSGPKAMASAFLGLVLLLLAAPWTTVMVGKFDVWLTTALLGPSPQSQLAKAVESAEAGREAAVDAAETERRRIERDLHDGAQQRLVALALDLGAARERLPHDPELGERLVIKAHEEAKEALREIRDLVRGIYPAILSDRGLDAALSAVVARCAVPVDLSVTLSKRPPETVESAAYFVVAEALNNVTQHSKASQARVVIAERGDRLLIEISDNGQGGANPSLGTGLAGLTERIAALGGTFDLLSPVGGPTTLLAEIPCEF